MKRPLAACWLWAAEVPLELLPGVGGMLGVMCGFVVCMCASSCVCVAAAGVEYGCHRKQNVPVSSTY